MRFVLPPHLYIFSNNDVYSRNISGDNDEKFTKKQLKEKSSTKIDKSVIISVLKLLNSLITPK